MQPLDDHDYNSQNGNVDPTTNRQSQSQWHEDSWQPDDYQGQGTPREQYHGPGAFIRTDLQTKSTENLLPEDLDKQGGVHNPVVGSIMPAPNAPLAYYQNAPVIERIEQPATTNPLQATGIAPSRLVGLSIAALIAIVLTIGGWWSWGLGLLAMACLLFAFFFLRYNPQWPSDRL